MKPAFTTLFGVVISAAMSGSSLASVVAFWDFNTITGINEAPQIVIPASQGTGTVYQQRADTDGNGKGGNAYANAPEGIDVVAGSGMAWDDIAKGGDNDAEFFITFSTTNIKDLVVSFDLRGNTGNIPSFDLKYSLTNLVDVTDPGDVIGTIKDFSGGLSTEIYSNYVVNAVASYTRIVLDLSSITALNNSAVVALRFDDWAQGTGNDDMRVDNFLVTGTAVPEPSSALLGLIGLTALLRRRR